MEWYEILLIVLAAAFVVGVAAWRVVRRMRGKGGSDCGCSSCAGCSKCSGEKHGK